MAFEFKLPQVSDDTEEGVVVVWFKREGARVTEGEPLLEVQMEKVSFEIEAPVAGTLVEIVAPKDAIVETGQVIARIETAQEAAETASESASQAAETEAPRPVRASPRAKRLAREHGIDLAAIQGTGTEGRVTEEDVQRVIDESAAGGARIPLQGMRATIARRMQESQRQTAAVTLFTEANVTRLVEARQQLKREFDVSYSDLLLKAAAIALQDHPHLNATSTEEEIHLHSAIHIGLAVAIKDGLQVPVIRDVNHKTLQEIAEAGKAAAGKARAGKLTGEDLEGATFSLTNLGTYDVDGFTPIINPPQVAILGVGRIVPRLALAAGEVVEWQMMTLSLTFDHRVVDGAPAAAFLQRVKQELEEPTWLP